MAMHVKVELTADEKAMLRQVASRAEQPVDLSVSVGAHGDLTVTLSARGTRSSVIVHVPVTEEE